MFSMNKVKWLWSITIAVGLVLIYAALSAYFVEIGDFYKSLKLPSFSLPPVWITIGWSIIYLVDIAVISRLIYYKESTYIVIPIMILGFLNVIWCIVFFMFNQIVLGFILLVLMLLLVFVITAFIIKEDSFSLIFWQIKIVWYIYVTVVGYYIMILNT